MLADLAVIEKRLERIRKEKGHERERPLLERLVTVLEEGRPLFVRTPDSTLSLANFMRAQLSGMLGTLRIGMDVLTGDGVELDSMFGHGGLFKTRGVGQRILAAALNTSVSVGEIAGEGGAWGIALLAACAPSATPTQPQAVTSDPGGKTLLALYMVGSNLEDDVKPRNGTPDETESGAISTIGASSFDLRELLEAWQGLDAAARSRLDVVVAFGGARKQGWQGVKYADMSCLLADGAWPITRAPRSAISCPRMPDAFWSGLPSCAAAMAVCSSASI